MKISRNWLNNYIVSNKTDDELVDAFTELGLECASNKNNSIDTNIVVEHNQFSVIEELLPGEYFVIITDAMGCIIKDSIVVKSNS